MAPDPWDAAGAVGIRAAAGRRPGPGPGMDARVATARKDSRPPFPGPDRPPRHRGGRAARLLLGLVALAGCACGPAAEPGPGLLLVTVDALRADRLACYGGPEGLGEGLCSVARDGALFRWAFSASPQGAPSAASLLTGRLPSQHGLTARPGAFLPGSARTLAERLARRGFATAAVVSSPELNLSRNLDQGFARWDGRGAGGTPAGRRGAAASVDAALRELERLEPPWLLWMHLGDLHGPFPPPPVESYEAYERRYRERLRLLDAEVARLLETVRALPEPVGILLAGLHGEAAGEGGSWYRHGHSLGPEQIRVPLLWRPPGGGSPVEVGVPVSTVDVLPTLLAVAGASGAEDERTRELEPPSPEGRALPGPGDPPSAPGRPRALFAELPGEVAVVSGRDYYARLRGTRRGARLAELPEDGSLPRPAPPPPDRAVRLAELEARLAELEDLRPPAGAVGGAR